VGKATNGLPTQNAFTILGADNSSFLNVVNTGKVSVGTSTSTDVKFSVNFNAGVSSNKAFVSNYTAAGDYSYANILNVDRDLTKALAIFNTTTNKENIVLFGDGTVNLKRLQIESLNDLQKTIAMKRAADGRETFVVYGNGDLWATGVHVRGMGNFPDYVFDKSYQLMPLNDLKKYIDEKKHLPNMPSAENIEKEGADLAELNRILVEKVEELTLYIIEQNTKIEALEEQKAIIAELIKEINILKSKF
jgi:hypothetical protein